MPELPEVEIVKQSLVKNVKSQKILQVIVRNRNLRFRIPRNFKHIIKKQKIINVRRFSKYIIIEFPNKLYCVLHLRDFHFLVHRAISFEGNLDNLLAVTIFLSN